jgi:hypothetical protein
MIIKVVSSVPVLDCKKIIQSREEENIHVEVKIEDNILYLKSLHEPIAHVNISFDNLDNCKDLKIHREVSEDVYLIAYVCDADNNVMSLSGASIQISFDHPIRYVEKKRVDVKKPRDVFNKEFRV